MRAVVLGATRGMGRAVARQLAGRGDRLFLLGRDPESLARSAADLEIRSADTVAAPVKTATCDLRDPGTFAPALDRADAELEGFDTVVVTAGVFASQQELERDAKLREELLAVDFVNTIQFCELARERLLARGGGTLCVFSSVAGDRARKPVVLYGAAKAGLSHYLTGLDHLYRSQGLRTILVKPGFVRTGMTAGLAPPPFAGDADRAALDVVRAIDRGRAVVYTPAIWRLVMLAIRSLPRAAMRRINF